MAKYKSLEFMGYPNYRVGDDGTVWSYRSYDTPGFGRRWRWRLVKSACGGRYPAVNLCHKGAIKNFQVHILVLLAFVGPRPSPHHVARHFPDRDTGNNTVDNLSWATPKRNQRDRVIHGTDSRGEKAYNAILTEKRVRLMRKMHATNRYYLRELAEKFRVSISTVHAVCVSRRLWNHIP